MRPLFKKGIILLIMLAGGGSARAQIGNPFSVDISINTENIILVDVHIPTNHYIYVDSFQVMDAVGKEQVPLDKPAEKTVLDPNTGKPKPVFSDSFSVRYTWAPSDEGKSAIHVTYWGCNDSVCFMPQTEILDLGKLVPKNTPPVKEEISFEASWEKQLKHFTIKGKQAGYIPPEYFLDFLDEVEGADAEKEQIHPFKLFVKDPVAFVRESGLLLTILFILAGGLLLNLTPCVLPMIPINLAIIGAGAQASSRKRGFALGGVYGLGIALVYGVMGLIVVLTGSQFGAIQSNPWFNLGIALIFVVLALAMFDVIRIDFSQYQNKIAGANEAQKKNPYWVALSMGGVAALLAGACVAPVVIAVLLLAARLGHWGLMLPFLLGLGMALPWPFAGAGLSFLPKPGKWTEWVKYFFGVGIIGFALYYSQLSYRGFRPAQVEDMKEHDSHALVDGRTNTGFNKLLQDAYDSGQPVFIDFWASWCKNCKTMDHTTFKDAMVQARLEDYRFIRYVAEDPNEVATKEVMKYFGVQGFPTFIVLEPAP